MKFTYYTIIGKDLNLLKGHIKNIKEYAGFDKLKCEKEILVIIYKNPSIPSEVTNKIIEYCDSQNIRTYVYDEPTNIFIQNLYACWNLGYELSEDGYVFRGGSDQVFSKDSFIHLYENAEKLRTENPNKKFILQSNTIENVERSPQSRHFVKSFGDLFENFKYDEFERFIEEINQSVSEDIIDITQSLKYWGKPLPLWTSLGRIDRVDGCSWLMTRQEFINYGPLPVIIDNITGDVLIHDKLQMAGYEEFIVKNCVTYHFVRGESLNQYN
jgi:hypothetical protein